MKWSGSSRQWPASPAVAATKPPRPARAKPATPLQRAVRLLARRDMSRAELESRLASGRAGAADEPDPQPLADDAEPGPGVAPALAAAPADEVAAALDRLAATGLQSDTRFAENYVRGRQSRAGSRRLAVELRQRGVGGEAIDAALATLDASDLERARALWARRFAPTGDPRERARQMRFLATRGFDMAVIRAVVGAAKGGSGVVDDDSDAGSADSDPGADLA